MKYSQPPTAAVSRHLPPPPVIPLRGYRRGSGVRSGGRSPGTSVLHSQTVATEDDRSLVKAVFTSSRFITRICTRLTCIRRKSSTFYRSSSGQEFLLCITAGLLMSLRNNLTHVASLKFRGLGLLKILYNINQRPVKNLVYKGVDFCPQNALKFTYKHL